MEATTSDRLHNKKDRKRIMWNKLKNWFMGGTDKYSVALLEPENYERKVEKIMTATAKKPATKKAPAKKAPVKKTAPKKTVKKSTKKK